MYLLLVHISPSFLTWKRENQRGFVVSFKRLLEKNFSESYKKEGIFLEDDREKNAAALFDTIDSFVCDDTVCKYVAVSLYSPARGLRSGRHPGGVNGTSADGRSPFPNTTTLPLQYGTRGVELNRATNCVNNIDLFRSHFNISEFIFNLVLHETYIASF